MEPLRRIAKAAEWGKMWQAYVAARTAVELAARAVVEMSLPRPDRCEDLPKALAGSLLGVEDADKLARVVKAAKELHKTQDVKAAERVAVDALELAEKLLKSIRRRYPAVEAKEGLRYALKAAGAKAAYSIGTGAVAVRAERALSLEEKIRLAADLSAEMGVPPERLVVSDVSEPGVLERVVKEGRIIYAEDLDEEIEWLAEKYIDYICC
ncbi:MAG: nucleotidyltransferase [Thermoproteus sp.]